MSRIGKKIILIKKDVTVKMDGSKISVKGPKGEMSITIRPEIEVKIDGDKIIVQIKKETKQANAYWGLTRALVENMIVGVSDGFEKKLELVGVGYRAKPIAGGVSLAVGYSHPVEFMAPKGVTIEVPDQTNITVSGYDKQQVGLAAALIRKVRKPEPYKGKGIKYAGEIVRRKAGKSGKV
jgi:large subunit ribosomal protein L6